MHYWLIWRFLILGALQADRGAGRDHAAGGVGDRDPIHFEGRKRLGVQSPPIGGDEKPFFVPMDAVEDIARLVGAGAPHQPLEGIEVDLAADGHPIHLGQRGELGGALRGDRDGGHLTTYGELDAVAVELQEGGGICRRGGICQHASIYEERPCVFGAEGGELAAGCRHACRDGLLKVGRGESGFVESRLDMHASQRGQCGAGIYGSLQVLAGDEEVVFVDGNHRKKSWTARMQRMVMKTARRRKNRALAARYSACSLSSQRMSEMWRIGVFKA